MNKKFDKNLMIKRLTEEGRADQIDDEIKAIMDNLDGQEAVSNCWRRVVYGEPVLWVVGKNGKGEYVNERDCKW